MKTIHWCMASLANGVYPVCRADGDAFLDTEAGRAELAGSPLGFKAVIVHLKGDWAEFCERFGFPMCKHNLRPCFFVQCEWRGFVFPRWGVSSELSVA